MKRLIDYAPPIITAAAITLAMLPVILFGMIKMGFEPRVRPTV